MGAKNHQDITAGAPAAAATFNAPLGQLDDALSDLQGVFGDMVVSGGLAGTSASLVISQPATRAWVLGQRVTAASALLTATATSDNYVDLDTAGNYHVTSVANGASPPPVFVNSIRLYLAVSNTTAITSVTSLMPTIATATGLIFSGNVQLAAGFFNVKASPYNAKGDGVTDDSGAINNAITDAAAVSGTVIMPAGTFFVASSINLQPNVALSGRGSNWGGVPAGGTRIQGAAGITVIQLGQVHAATNGHNLISDVEIYQGAKGLSSLQYSTHVTVDRVHFNGQSLNGIYIEGAIEEWRVSNCRISGAGADGFRIANVVNWEGDNYIDKSSFYDLYITGCLGNGVKWECLRGSTNNFYSPIFNFNHQNGFYADAALDGLKFDNVNCESNGSSGKTVLTTGSITSGSPNLTVASGAGIVNGDPITVKGAGSFKDLVTTVLSGGGTVNLVLNANAGTTVSNVEVTTRSYDDFVFNNSIGGTPGGLVWIGGVFGIGSFCRYAIKGDLVNSASAIGCETSRPMYLIDQATIMGGDPCVRQVNAIGQSTMRNTLFAGPNTGLEFPWAMLGSPPGKPFYIVLRDSLDNGTGTYDKFEVLLRNGNSVLDVTSDYGVTVTESIGYLQSNGPIKARNQIYPSTPGAALQTACAIWAGSGAPNNAQGANGDIYFRSDGGAGTTVYHKESGSWVGRA